MKKLSLGIGILLITFPFFASAQFAPVVNYVQAKAVDVNEAFPGEQLSVYGSNLASDYGASETYFYICDQQAPVTQLGDTFLSVSVPSNLTNGNCNAWLQNNKGTSNAVNVRVLGKIPNISYVQSPAQYSNILHPGERTTIYGTYITSDYLVIIISKSGTYNSNNANLYNVWSSNQGADFIVPNLPNGSYDLYLKKSNSPLDIISNKIQVSIVNPTTQTNTAVTTPTKPTYIPSVNPTTPVNPSTLTEAQRQQTIMQLQQLLAQLIQQLINLLQAQAY
jgi:hypothetical protein